MKRINPFTQIYRSPDFVDVNNRPLRDFPFIVDVEPTNFCNLRCIFCGQRIMTRERGYMSEAVFRAVADECARNGAAIRFIRWGEPLLHPLLFDFIAYAKKKGILVHLTTNGLLLNKEKTKRLIELGLDSIVFSMQGVTPEEYRVMRNNDKYAVLESNILEFVRIRAEMDAERPWIHISTTITDETPEEVEAFKARWLSVVDSVGVGRTNLERVALRENVAAVKPHLPRQTIKKEYRRCTEVRQKLSVNWNGDVTACCSDYDGKLVIGNIKQGSLKAWWHSRELDRIREILDAGRFQELDPCYLCYHTYDEF